MKFYTNIAFAIAAPGALLTLSGVLRYTIFIDDPSEALTFFLIGVLFLIVAVIFDRQKEDKDNFKKEKDCTHAMGSEVNQQYGDIQEIKDRLDVLEASVARRLKR